MFQKIQAEIRQLWLVKTYREKDSDIPTDESKQIQHSTLHQNTIGFTIWLAFKQKIDAYRTRNNNPKGDVRFTNFADVTKFSDSIHERYYQYNAIDSIYLDGIEFRKRQITRPEIARAVIAKGKSWYVTTGRITPDAMLVFQKANIKYLEYTSEEDVLEYLNSKSIDTARQKTQTRWFDRSSR